MKGEKRVVRQTKEYLSKGKRAELSIELTYNVLSGYYTLAFLPSLKAHKIETVEDATRAIDEMLATISEKRKERQKERG